MKTTTTKKIKNLQKALAEQDQLQMDILNELQERWPSVTSVYLSRTRIEINTKHHNANMSQYNNWKAFISMTCDKETMPETVEEFLAAKAMMEQDRKEAHTALFHLAFSYRDYSQPEVW